jgi:predicted PurR-regulated permease PerM
MLEDHASNRQRFSTIVLTAAVFLGFFLCYFLAIPFLPAIVWSFTLAVLFVPLNRLIHRAFRSSGLSAATTVAIVALIVVVPAITVIGILANEAVGSASSLSAMVDAESWQRAIDNRPRLAPVIRAINQWVDVPELIQSATKWLAGWSSIFVKGSITGMITLLLTFYFLFYLLRDRERVLAATQSMLPLSGPEFSKLADRIAETIFASVYGTTAVAALQGGLGAAMFWWLELPAPLFWGVLMGLLAVVPFLGAFVVWAPTAVFLAIAGEYQSAALLAVWGTIVIGLVDNVLYPILVGKRLKLDTVPSFIAVAGGLIVFGTPGIVLGPIIMAGSHTLLDIWRQRVAHAS